MNKMTKKPLAIALGAAFVTSMAVVPTVSADANPFGMSDLGSGYMVVADNHAGDKAKEGKCGEGKCGAEKKAAKEGKCGDGKCGAEKKAEKEGKCGGGKE